MMKKLVQFSTLFALLLSLSIFAMGQYTGSNPNVAAFKRATANDTVPGFEPEKAVDTLSATYCSVPGDAPAWLQIDLGAYHYIDGFGMILPNADELALTITFQTSDDSLTWDDKEEYTIDASGTYGYDFIKFGPVRYVRIYITEKDPLASFTEVMVYGYEIVPPTPPIALPASDILSTGFTANWSERVIATGYTLSIATDIGFNNYVSGYDHRDVGDVFNWEVTDLSPLTSYYYRVQALNVSGASVNSNRVEVTTLKQTQTITFNTLPEKVYGDADFDLSATASSGLPVSFSSSDVSVATINGITLTIVGVGTTVITATQDGDSEYGVAEPILQDQLVISKELTVSSTAAANMVYDGTADALLSGAVLDGVVGDDDVILADADIGVFVQSDVGTAISVTTSMTLSGADLDNYSLVQPADLSADITALELTVAGAIAENKVYDGATGAVITGGTLNGVIDGDDVGLAASQSGDFAQSDAGTGIEVSTSMTLSGADHGNYTLEQPSGLTADISGKDLHVTANDKSREACEVNPEFTVSYSGFVGTEDKSVLTTEPLASSDADENSAAGSYDITVSGGSATNYVFTFISGTLTITPDITNPTLTVQDITVELDAAGTATITPADVVASADDNCGVVDTTLSQDTFTVDDIGNAPVQVAVVDAAGNSTSAFAIVTVKGPTGFDEFSAIEARVYPNPTDGILELVIDSPADVLKVMDMTGKTIIKRSNLSSQETFDLSGYSNGIYIFQLQSGQEMMHIKVIKK